MTEPPEVKRTWKTFCEKQLSEGYTVTDTLPLTVSDRDYHQEFKIDEFVVALHSMKKGKAASLDEIAVELFSTADEAKIWCP